MYFKRILHQHFLVTIFKKNIQPFRHFFVIEHRNPWNSELCGRVDGSNQKIVDFSQVGLKAPEPVQPQVRIHQWVFGRPKVERCPCFLDVKGWCFFGYLGGGFNFKYFLVWIWGRFPIWLIFFRWVETANYFFLGGCAGEDGESRFNVCLCDPFFFGGGLITDTDMYYVYMYISFMCVDIARLELTLLTFLLWEGAG